MQDNQDNQGEGGKVLPFEKPAKKPKFKSISLDELKERMKKGGFQPFDKAAFKKQVSKQHNPGNSNRGEFDENLIQNIKELQEVCRILSQNLQMVHKETENRITDLEGHISWMEGQLLDLSGVVQKMTMYLEKAPPPQ